MMHLLTRAPKLVLDKATGKHRRKSHKVTAGPLCPNEDVVLAAIRAAHRKPIALTEAQVRVFEAFRKRGNIGVYRPEPREVNGQVVFRRQGKAGTHLPMPPMEWDLRQALASHRVMMANLNRRPPDPKLAAHARDIRAKARAAPVLLALEKFSSLGCRCGAAVAEATGEDIRYVQRVRRKNAHDAVANFSESAIGA